MPVRLFFVRHRFIRVILFHHINEVGAERKDASGTDCNGESNALADIKCKNHTFPLWRIWVVSCLRRLHRSLVFVWVRIPPFQQKRPHRWCDPERRMRDSINLLCCRRQVRRQATPHRGVAFKLFRIPIAANKKTTPFGVVFFVGRG